MRKLVKLFFILCLLPASITYAQNSKFESAEEERDILLERLNTKDISIRIDTIYYFGGLSYLLPIFKNEKFEYLIEFINMDFRYSISNSDFHNFGNVSSISIAYHPQVIVDIYFRKGIKYEINDKKLQYLKQENIKNIEIKIWPYKDKFYQKAFKVDQ